MMQEINLLKTEKKSQKFDLDFLNMVKIVILFMVILLLVSIYTGMQSFSSLQAVRKIETEKKVLENELAKQQALAPQKQAIDQLNAMIQVQVAAMKIKKEILNKLIDSEAKQLGGFSEYMASLSRKTIPGLWLTRMVFNTYDAHYTLEGKTLQPELIPKFMEGLSKEAIFAGKTFQVFKVSVDKRKGLDFLLETSAKPEKKT